MVHGISYYNDNKIRNKDTLSWSCEKFYKLSTQKTSFFDIIHSNNKNIVSLIAELHFFNARDKFLLFISYKLASNIFSLLIFDSIIIKAIFSLIFCNKVDIAFLI